MNELPSCDCKAAHLELSACGRQSSKLAILWRRSIHTHLLPASLQVVVNALIQAIPAIFNVLLVCLVFWLIFSIMGVNLFGGKFSGCVDVDGELVSFNVVTSKNDCLALAPLYNYTWFTPKVNFDNCLIAYLSLFQVVSATALAGVPLYRRFSWNSTEVVFS